MSMKRILGMMLASRMAGRGGLGGLAAGGLLGGRRGGFGRKAGLATLGYMAYRAYQDYTSRNGGSAQRTGTGSQMMGQSGSGGGLGSALKDIATSVTDALSGQNQAKGGRAMTPTEPAPEEPGFTADDEQAAEAFSEDTALMLIRAMVTAANADGTITEAERARILAQADQAGADATEREVLERELANPRPIDELLGGVKDEETAEEFYLASRLAVDETTEANRAYLVLLRERLGLSEQQAEEIELAAT